MYNGPSLIIVLGGTFASTIASYPMEVIQGLPRTLGKVFRSKTRTTMPLCCTASPFVNNHWNRIKVCVHDMHSNHIVGFSSSRASDAQDYIRTTIGYVASITDTQRDLKAIDAIPGIPPLIESVSKSGLGNSSRHQVSWYTARHVNETAGH